jgi:demethylmenaquinone methyltransferase/2-methoxy-6-polyprenyl-1,4-benzoquinol methylase
MFDAIAPGYDRLNALFSLGRDRGWRRRAARETGLQPGQVALDICTGTGALAVELWRRVRPGGRVIGIDQSPQMLARARSRPGLEFLVGDATALTYPDHSFDAVAIGFGLRNLTNRALGLMEMHRVLRPGGRAVILEFSPPADGLLAATYRFYLGRVMPAVAGLINRSYGDAYRYLAESIAAFPSPTALADELEGSGFHSVRIVSLTFGIANIHIATAE